MISRNTKILNKQFENDYVEKIIFDIFKNNGNQVVYLMNTKFKLYENYIYI